MRKMNLFKSNVIYLRFICAAVILIIVILVFNEFFSNTLQESIITLQCNDGRLGNQMCSYATLYGLAALNNRKINVMPCTYNSLMQIFDIHASVVDLATFKEEESWEIGNYLRPEDTSIPKTTNIIKGYLRPCSYTYYNHIRKHIKNEFTFKRDITLYARNILEKVKANRNDVTFIGVHVRRTDFVNQGDSWLMDYEGREVDMEFFEKAIRYYKDKYPNSLFVAVSDDRSWCRRNLRGFGVHVLEDMPSPAHDMAIMANCNHSIMTYGTFGFWSSYLAGGEVVYFDQFLNPDAEFTKKYFQFENMYLPEWIGISTNSSFK